MIHGEACAFSHGADLWGSRAFIEGYAAYFNKIRTALERNTGFMLLPVDVPSRDVGRALADYLKEHGLEALLLDPSTEQWASMPDLLLSLPRGEQGPIVLLGPREKSPELLLGIQRMNLARDNLVPYLARPLIWCGQSFFLEATRYGAPDFWSVRDISESIPLREGAYQQVERSWDPFVRKPPLVDELRERETIAREARDEPNLLRTLLALSKALVGWGRTEEAIRPMEEAEKLLSLLVGKHGYKMMEEAQWRELKGDITAAQEGFPDAERYYEQALDICSALPDIYASIRLLGKLGIAASKNKDEALAGARFGEAMAKLEQGGDDTLRAELLLARSEWRADMDVALHLYEEQGDDWGRGRALLMRGRHRWAHDDCEGAAQDFDEAIGLMEKGADIVGLAGAYLSAGAAASRGYSSTRKADFYLEKAIHHAGLVRDLDVLEEARGIRGERRYRLHDDEEGALEDLDFALMRAQDPDHWKRCAYIYYQRGQLHHEMGNVEQSASDLEQAILLGEKSKAFPRETEIDIYFKICHNYICHLNRLSDAERLFPIFEQLVQQDAENQEAQAHYLWIRGGLRERLAIGDSLRVKQELEQTLESVLQDYADARTISVKQADKGNASTLSMHRAKLLVLLNRPDEAIEEWTQALDLARRARAPGQQIDALANRALLYIAGGNLKRAGFDLNLAQAKARSPKAGKKMGSIVMALSMLELRRGRFKQSIRHLRQLERAAERAQPKNLQLQALALVEQSRVYFLSGLAAESRVLAHQAMERLGPDGATKPDLAPIYELANALLEIASLNRFAFKALSRQARRQIVI